MTQAIATFRNETYEQETYDDREGTSLGRIQIERIFEGDIEGNSTAELLTASTESGSATYVALDRITGRLAGRAGAFVLEHHGTVTAEGASTAGAIVPDSGTGELRGLRGEARISVENGVHRLFLEYEIEDG